MIRFSSRILKQTLNQWNIIFQQRCFGNFTNQLTSNLESKIFPQVSIGTKINYDPSQSNLPTYKKDIVLPSHNPTSILENYNNVFGYVSNYRHIYMEKPNSSIEAPAGNANHKYHCKKLGIIVIRRRKIKKHKLKKLRKKMKFEWAKVRQKREMRKEKAFQALLLNQIKEAEKFSAEQYVEAKLKQANEVPIPRFWKGRRLPQFIIKEKLGIK